MHLQSSSVSGVLPASTEQTFWENGGLKHQTAQTLWLHNARGARDSGGLDKYHLSEDCDSNPSSRKAENEPVCEPTWGPSGMQMKRCPEHESCASDAQSRNLGFSIKSSWKSLVSAMHCSGLSLLCRCQLNCTQFLILPFVSHHTHYIALRHTLLFEPLFF